MALQTVKYDMKMVIKTDFTNDQLYDMGLTRRLWKRSNKEYYIYRYIKDKLTKDTHQTLGLFRSIVVLDGEIVSFAPPKSIDCEAFIEKHSLSECILEEFIDGTMINLFYVEGLEDEELGNWEIATRSFVGGDFSFFFNPENPMTFRTMFIHAVKEHNIDLSRLSPKYSYSFVLQHPNNRIVTPQYKPSISLTDVYSIDEFNISKVDKMEFVDTLPIPKRYNNSEYCSFQDIYDKFTSTKKEDYKTMGVIILNGEDRTKFRNPAYEVVRELRGNQPKLQYTYLELRRKSRQDVLQYLEYYPEHREEFNKFNKQVKQFSETLYNKYHLTQVKRKINHKDLAYQYKPHVYTLHNEYLNILKKNGEFITREYVNNYIDKLETAKLMYALNYSMRTSRKVEDAEPGVKPIVEPIVEPGVDEVQEYVSKIVDDIVDQVISSNNQ